MRKVIMVFKSHLDMGYTDLSKNVLRHYCTDMLEEMLMTCEGTANQPEGQRYVWTMPAGLLHYILSSKQTTIENKKRLEECIWQRQVVWTQMPFTIHTEFCSLEEIIRGFRFSDELAKKYHYHPVTAKMTDVPGHTTYLASILHKQGVKFMHIGCNPCCMPPDVPRLFWWQGPDGGQVLTMYNKGQYGSSMTPPKDWPYPVWLALMQTNDNKGTLTKEQVCALMEQARNAMPDAEILIGTLDDFWREISQYDLSDIPVVRKDLADTWIHGIASYPREVGELRESRNLLSEAEKLSALCQFHGLFSEQETEKHRQEAEKAYTQGLLFDEHTWGMAGLTSLGRERHYYKKEFLGDLAAGVADKACQSWEEQRKRVRIMKEHTKMLMEQAASTWADAVLQNEREIVVFNGLSWDRNGDFEVTRFLDWLKDDSLLDEETQELVTVFSQAGKTWAYVKNVPAMGWKKLLRVKVKKPKVTITEDEVLENHRFRIKVDPSYGGLISLFDKTTQYEYVEKNQVWGRYIYDVYGDKSERSYLRKYVYRFVAWVIDDLARINMPEQEEQSFELSECTVRKIQSGPILALQWFANIHDESTQEYGNARKVSFTLMLSEKHDIIDFLVSIHDKQESAFPESGSLSLPFAMNDCKILINKLGTVIDPLEDIEKDANHVLYCCENWLSLENKDTGMLIVPIDTPLFGIGTKGIYDFESSRKSVSSHIYFDLFNTQWGTNFPQWIGGDITCRFRLIPLTGKETMEEKQRLALSVAIPFVGARSICPSSISNQIARTSLFRCQSMRVLSVLPESDNKRIQIRIQDISGKPGEAVLQFDDIVESVQTSGNGIDDIEVPLSRGKTGYVLQTMPYEIHTLKIERKI